MSDDQLKGTPFEAKSTESTIPKFLRNLTTLTYIGCGISLFFSLLYILTAKTALDKSEEMQGSDLLEKLPNFMKSWYTPEAIQFMRVMYENRIPITVTGILGVALCFWGARQMRSARKQGYYLWLVGEILPLISSFIFIGGIGFGDYKSIFGLGLSVVFIILYSTQLKFMK